MSTGEEAGIRAQALLMVRAAALVVEMMERGRPGMRIDMERKEPGLYRLTMHHADLDVRGLWHPLQPSGTITMSDPAHPGTRASVAWETTEIGRVHGVRCHAIYTLHLRPPTINLPPESATSIDRAARAEVFAGVLPQEQWDLSGMCVQAAHEQVQDAIAEYH